MKVVIVRYLACVYFECSALLWLHKCGPGLACGLVHM